MTSVSAFLARLWKSPFKLFRRRAGSRRALYRLEAVEDLPEEPAPHILYVAGEGEYAWAAAMLCPCGCGDAIQLSLLEDARPHWTVKREQNGTPSVMPSVWRRKGCRSHFFLRRGRIVWCQPDPRMSGPLAPGSKSAGPGGLY